MAYRLYLSDIVGDGQTTLTAYRSRFAQLCTQYAADTTPENPSVITGVTYSRQIIDAKNMQFAVGVAELDDATHDIFVADTGIRHIPRSFMLLTRGELTPEQLGKLNEILTYFGYSQQANNIFTDSAHVYDLVWWMMGRMEWDGWEVWNNEATD